MIDASAGLAFLNAEPGATAVRSVIEAAAISAINWSEILQKAAAKAISLTSLAEDLRGLGLSILAFDDLDASRTAALWPITRSKGLSLADRACLALAQRLAVPALTADRTWADLEVDVDVQFIR